uniref:F-box and leucine rich repeat protein 18 n=1 Tax=Pan troglodytes TaxID=9598 RepID=A0A2I3TWH4_PANTR
MHAVPRGFGKKVRVGPLLGPGGPPALLRVLVSAEEPALPGTPRADRVQLLLRHAPQRARHPQLAPTLQPRTERRGLGGGRHRPAGLPAAPDARTAAQRPYGLRAGQYRPAMPAVTVPVAGQPGHDGEGGVHARALRHVEALQAAEGPQAGAALLQRQRPVLPGAEPVPLAAAPVPGLSQRHPPARCRAGFHGSLPAGRHVPPVHRGVPRHLQEPAAVASPQLPGRAARVKRRRLPSAPRGPDRRHPGRPPGAPGRDHLI